MPGAFQPLSRRPAPPSRRPRETYRSPRRCSVRPRGPGGTGGARGRADVDRLPRRPELPLGRQPRRPRRRRRRRPTQRSCGFSSSGTSRRRRVRPTRRIRSIRRTSSTTSTRPSEPRRRTTRRSSSRSRARRGGRTAARARTSCRRTSPTSPRSLARSPRATRAASWGIRSSASGRSGTSRTCQRFLTPQFNAAGKSVAPANYAKLAAAAYAGIKAGNPQAQVAIGETSARGSDKPQGLRPTHSPGKFAELVAKANPSLKFDAWSHHPYPFNPTSPPTAGREVAERLAGIASAVQREPQDVVQAEVRADLDHRVRAPDEAPGRVRGLVRAHRPPTSSSRSRWSTSYPFVSMFIWFVFQDDQGQPWESGVYTEGGAPKGTSPTRFSASARPLDARNGVATFRGGTVTPLVNVYTRRYCATDPTGTTIGMTWRVFRGGKLIAVGQQTSPLKLDCTIARGFASRSSRARPTRRRSRSTTSAASCSTAG